MGRDPESLPDPVTAPALAKLLGIEVSELLLAGQNERLRGRNEFPRPRLTLIPGRLCWPKAEIVRFFQRNPDTLIDPAKRIIVALNSAGRSPPTN